MHAAPLHHPSAAGVDGGGAGHGPLRGHLLRSVLAVVLGGKLDVRLQLRAVVAVPVDAE